MLDGEEYCPNLAVEALEFWFFLFGLPQEDALRLSNDRLAQAANELTADEAALLHLWSRSHRPDWTLH